jgi:DNA-directed RNA polymerase subunit E'/Rpb7
MFREVDLVQTVRIPPSALSSNIREIVQAELYNTVEGMYTRESGLVLCVKELTSTGTGRVSQRSGYALFDVKFKAIVCKPIREQTIDAVIRGTSIQGIGADAGPVDIFIAKSRIPPHFKFDLNNSAFESTSGQTMEVLGNGTAIRVRITSDTVLADGPSLKVTATMLDPELGSLGTHSI